MAMFICLCSVAPVDSRQGMLYIYGMARSRFKGFNIETPTEKAPVVLCASDGLFYMSHERQLELGCLTAGTQRVAYSMRGTSQFFTGATLPQSHHFCGFS